MTTQIIWSIRLSSTCFTNASKKAIVVPRNFHVIACMSISPKLIHCIKINMLCPNLRGQLPCAYFRCFGWNETKEPLKIWKRQNKRAFEDLEKKKQKIKLMFMNEETIDHLLINCAKTRVLWEIFFSLVRVFWVLPLSIKETLLNWHGLFVGKKHKKVWRADPLHIFWTVWKATNQMAFDDNMLSTQKLKYSFAYSLWSETKLFIDDYPLTLVNFIDWLGSYWGCFNPICLVDFLSSFGRFGNRCIGIVYLDSLFRHLFFNKYIILPIKKKILLWNGLNCMLMLIPCPW